MMKPKLIISLVLLFMLVVVFFMVKDFFFNSERSQKNPYAYDLSKFEDVNEEQICYTEAKTIKPGIKKLNGIAIDENDNIYVSGSNRVQIFDKSGNHVSNINTNKTTGSITIGRDGKIYLSATDHVEIWNNNGELIEIWDTPHEKCLITSIAVSETSVFVADAGNKIVYHYNLSGELINNIGRKNKEKGVPGFFIPSPYFDLLIGREGELWVVNPGRHSFETYNKQGELISSWSRTSAKLEGFSGCCNPSHIAMLSNGSFVTSEKGLVRVKIHSPSGDFKCVVAQPNQFDEETRGLDLAVDSDDRILVLDPKKGIVRIFEEIPNPDF